MRYDFTPTSVTVIKHKQVLTRVREKRGRCWSCVKWQPLQEIVWRILRRSNIKQLYDPAVAPRGPYPEDSETGLYRNPYRSVHSISAHNSWKVQTAWISIKRRVDQQNLVYPYRGHLFSNREELSTDLCCKMDEP